MSQAFVKEQDAQWLHEVPPSLHALLLYLTRENGGIRVFEKKFYTGQNGREIYEMSNGLSYTKDEENKWQILW